MPDDEPKRTPPQFAQAVELTTAAYDQIARDYADRNERVRGQWHADRMEQFVELLAENDERRPIPDLGRPGDDCTLEEYLQLVPVLDAGCGPGRDARALAEHGLPVLGVDLSQGMLDEAGARTPRRLRTGAIRYALMDLRLLDLPDRSCRGVWCSASLLHLPKRVAPRAAAELARVTRSGGPVMVFVKARTTDEPEERMVPYEYADVPGVRRFYAYYTEDEARKLLEGAGLDVLETDTVPDERRTDAPNWISLVARKP